MIRNRLLLGILALFALSFTTPAGAEKAHDMEMMKTQAQGETMAMEVVRVHTLEGVKLTYQLIDMKARMAKMEGMKGMEGKMASHHLMLEVKKAGGGAVAGVSVGFKVTAPDGTVQKAMAMHMKGGHGADVDMAQKGTYQVAVKIGVGSRIIRDSFTLNAE